MIITFISLKHYLNKSLNYLSFLIEDFLNVSSAYNAKESKSPTSPINVIGKNNQLNVFWRSVSKRISLITSKTITPHCFKGLSSPTTEDRKKKFNEFGNFSLVNI